MEMPGTADLDSQQGENVNREAKSSEAETLEAALGNQPNGSHNHAPEPWHVYDFGAFAIRGVNQVGGFSRRNREQRALASPRHARVYRAELHRHHMHSAGGQAPTKSLRKSGERTLGRSVHVVFLAAPFARD